MVNSSSRCGCCGQCNLLCELLFHHRRPHGEVIAPSCMSCCFSIVDHGECNNFFFCDLLFQHHRPRAVSAMRFVCFDSFSNGPLNNNDNLQFELFQHLYIFDQQLSTRVM